MAQFLAFFFGFPLFFSLVIGSLILVKFGRDPLSRLAGLFTLKPIVAYPLWLVLHAMSLILRRSKLDIGENPTLIESLQFSLLAIAPAVLLTLLLVVVFRGVFKKEKMAWMLLLGDGVRWLYALTWSLSLAELPATLSFIGFLLPTLYALIALDLVSVRSRSLSEAH